MSIIWSNKLTSNTYMLYAIRNYHNGVGVWGEFFYDIKMFSRISKILMTRVNSSSETSTSVQNILNNFISLGNVFIGDSLGRLAFFIINPICYPEVKTILEYMHRLPRNIPEVKLSSIEYDQKLFYDLNQI